MGLSRGINDTYYQGEYNPVNPEKYVSNDGKPPFYRSSYERRFFHYCDHNENVVKWGSEVFPIPYQLPGETKSRKYWPDNIVMIRDKSGVVKTYIVEIKPQDQVKEPNQIKLPKRKTVKAMENYMYAYEQAVKNKMKWDAARSFCESRGYEFQIITEKELFNE